MISLKAVRTLNLHESSAPGRSAFVAAASGLVLAGDWLYVVADDENHLAVFPAGSGSAGTLQRLFSGELPSESTRRKGAKPDLEALTLVPSRFHPPHGALLALPSGSRPNRNRGALIALTASGALAGAPTALDLSGLFAFLEAQIGAFNLESVAISGERLCLIHRGNRKRSGNALVTLPVTAALASMQSGRPPPADTSAQREIIHLGELDGVPYTITDAAPLDAGRLVFTAAAENTEDSYTDGACRGSGIGILNLQGRVVSFHGVDAVRKLEGVAVTREGRRLRLLLVNDEDDPTHPSQLFEAEIPLPPPGTPAPA